jgi:TRAP-type C4-dicarboxylate transport system substrate-binding protein
VPESLPVLRFAGYQPAASIHTKAAAHLGALLRDATGDDGSFEQTVSILDEGHKAGALPDLVASGAYDMAYMATIRFAPRIPALRLFDAPFVIADRVRVWRELDGPFGDAIRDAFAASTPWRVLGFWDNGFRQISNGVRPLREPADCRGLSIRVQQNDDIVETFERIGFTVRPTDISEAVPALAAGRIDAQENPLTSINAFGIQRFHKHITLTAHVFGVALLLCNGARYESWPVDFRRKVFGAAEAATALQRRLAVEQDATLRGAFEAEGVAFVDLDDAGRAAFATAAAPVTERLAGVLDAGLIRRLRG